MKIFLILLISFDIFGILISLEDFSENKSNGSSAAELIMPPNAISPEIVPAFSSNPVDLNSGFNGQQIYSNTPCQTSCNSQGAQCKTDCSSSYTSCPKYCNQAPQLCSSGCQQQSSSKTVTVQVPVRVSKIVPEKVTRKVQKQPRSEKLVKETDIIRQCPKNYKMIENEDDKQRCVAERASSISCPVDYVFKNEKCIRTITTCANEYTKILQKCTLRVVCPQNYHQHGDECVPPVPQCPYSWNWNGRLCEPERLSCPSGYTLGQNNQCIHEIQRCPPYYKEFGNECLMEEPGCAYDFHINANTNVCEKVVNKCPSGSYDQLGDCVKVSYGCPTGAKDAGNYCTFEDTVQKVVYEIKYVPQTMTLPGPITSNCNSYGNYGSYGSNANYGCASPCINNCVSRV